MSNLVCCLAGREYGCFVQRKIELVLEKKVAASSTLELSYKVPLTARSTFCIGFSPDRRKIATGHGDHSVRISDCIKMKIEHVLKGHSRTPWCVEFHPKINSLLASGCLSGQVFIWNLDNKDQTGTLIFQSQSAISSIAFHPIDSILAITSGNILVFYDWNQFKVVKELKTKTEIENVRYVKFLPLGDKLLTGIRNHPSQVQNIFNTSTENIATRPVVSVSSLVCSKFISQHYNIQNCSCNKYCDKKHSKMVTCKEKKLIMNKIDSSLTNDFHVFNTSNGASCSSNHTGNEKRCSSNSASNNVCYCSNNANNKASCSSNNASNDANCSLNNASSKTSFSSNNASNEASCSLNNASNKASNCSNNASNEDSCSSNNASNKASNCSNNASNKASCSSNNASNEHSCSSNNASNEDSCSVSKHLTSDYNTSCVSKKISSSERFEFQNCIKCREYSITQNSSSLYSVNGNSGDTRSATPNTQVRQTENLTDNVMHQIMETELYNPAVRLLIAQRFAAHGSIAVASNIAETTNRIQLWNSSNKYEPDIKNITANVVISRCKIHNDNSIDISSDGSLLAAFLPIKYNSPMDIELQVISLKPENYLNCIYSKKYGPNAVSISFSPLYNYVVVGLASRKFERCLSIPKNQVIGQILDLQADSEKLLPDSKVVFNIIHENSYTNEYHFSVNTVRFHPMPGMGIVYGSNRGHVQHFLIGPDLNLMN